MINKNSHFVVKKAKLFFNDLERDFDLKNNIVNYNSNWAFASREANYDRVPGRGPYCMRIHGMIYHHFSSLRPRVSGNEKYAQLYILDNAEAINQRMGYNLNSYYQYFKFLIKNSCRLRFFFIQNFSLFFGMKIYHIK